MACCLAGKKGFVPDAAHPVRTRHPRASTLEKAVVAAEMFRSGCTLARIGERFGCSREWARKILGVARSGGIMQDREYEMLKGKCHYKKAQVYWQYFCDVADNIEDFNKDKFNELKAKYWPCEKTPTARAAYAEQSCLEALVRKGRISNDEAGAIAYLIYKFKQSRTTPARLKEDALYFMRNKRLSLRDFALERRICNNGTNPAAQSIRRVVLAMELGIIPQEEYDLRSLANFHKVFSVARKPAPGRKYPEHTIRFVLVAHEKTGLPYARIARFAEVPVQAVYDYKRRQDKLH
ncbi:MAG: hypothetical protein QXK08_04260 [Candidatus Woesearchaeota archaeon]